MRRLRVLAAGMGCAVLLGGCSSKPVPPNPTVEIIPAPNPSMAFDAARGRRDLAAAKAARAGGDLARARSFALASVYYWPILPQAWGELLADCQGLKDPVCTRHAEFFHDKITFLSSQPPRAGVLGMQNLLDAAAESKARPANAKPQKSKESKDDLSGGDQSGRVDDWITAYAARIMYCYNRQDSMAALRNAPVGDMVSDKYPPGKIAAGALAVVGTGVAISHLK